MQADEAPGAAAYKPVVLADDEALREYLDALNEAGTTPIAVGFDSCPRPFLITLIGPYAESEDVFFDSPWQTDCDYGERVDGVWVPKPRRCDDCLAVSHGIEDLRFPVTVLTTAGPDEERCGPHCEPAAIEQHCACASCHG